MDPLNWERGKHYYSIRCQNVKCHQTLALAEVPDQLSAEELTDLRKQVEGQAVRCPICTQETPIEQRRVFVLEVQ